MKTAKVFKLSKTKKSMLVGVKASAYAIGFSFAWCANPDMKHNIGDSLEGFNPIGTKQVIDEKNNPVVHKADNSPVLQWIF